MRNIKRQEQELKAKKASGKDREGDNEKEKAETGKGNLTIRPEQGPDVPPEDQTLGNP